VTSFLAEEDGQSDPISAAEVEREATGIDEELTFYDNDGDGYITYSEFMRNHRKRIEVGPQLPPDQQQQPQQVYT